MIKSSEFRTSISHVTVIDVKQTDIIQDETLS